MCLPWGRLYSLGFIAAFVLKFSVPAVYMILMCDELIKVPITWYRYRSYKWLRNVTREELEMDELLHPS